MVVVTMLTGWPGRTQAVPAGGPWGSRLHAPARLRPSSVLTDGGVIYAVEPHEKEGVALTAASSELTLHKVVTAAGHTSTVLRRGRDCVHLVTTSRAVTVTRGGRTRVVGLAEPEEKGLPRGHGLLVDSPAVRVCRALAAALEDAGAPVMPVDVPDAAGYRREYQQALVTARAALVACSGPLYWNPQQRVCGFAWMQQVEGAWHRLLTRTVCRAAADPVRQDHTGNSTLHW